MIDALMRCLSTRVCMVQGEGWSIRVIYRLWQTAGHGYLIEAAGSAGLVGPAEAAGQDVRSAAEAHAVWVKQREDADSLFAHVAREEDPVLPVHLPDVIEDRLREFAGVLLGPPGEPDLAAEAPTPTKGDGELDDAPIDARIEHRSYMSEAERGRFGAYTSAAAGAS